MQDPDKPMRLKFEAHIQGGGLISRIVAAVLGVAVVFAALFLSVFVFAGLLAVGVIAGAWMWWRTRRLRRQLRETLDAATREALQRNQARSAQATSADRGTVIDGDFIRPKATEDAKRPR